MGDVERFLELRPRLLGIAYRMLGSAADAEELVQDAYLRWQQRPRDEVVSTDAFLVKTITRLALDRLSLARNRREVYPGTWLPEPVGSGWAGMIEDPKAVSLAVMVLLETLSPLERAVYVLHELFDYEHAEIAELLDRDEAACRQLLRRARQHLEAGQPRYEPSAEEHERLLDAFMNACRSGELGLLENLLAEPVTLYADGGGRVAANLAPLSGRELVARFLLGQMRRKTELSISIETIAGRPAIVSRRGDRTVEDVLDLVSDGQRIVAIYAVRNPEKLQRVNAR